MLWKQHRDLLPPYWQDIACLRPSDQQLSKVKKENIMREDNNSRIKKMKEEQSKQHTAEKMSSDFAEEDEGHSV